MKLQKLIHAQNDILTDNGRDAIIVHGVNEINLGGEYTICGRAITDSVYGIEGWERIGEQFVGNIRKCECGDCLRIIHYYKSLR